MATITHSKLMELLRYDPKSGLFIRRVSRQKHCAGEVAGVLNDQGYIVIKIEGRSYKAHRLAWFYMTGEWPKKDVDHRNRCRSDNRWRNLRDVSRTINVMNTGLLASNTSGFRGVTYLPRQNRWLAKCRRQYLGVFRTAQEASAAYEAARAKTMGGC